METSTMTYSEILEFICDEYDEIVKPKFIRRDASNPIYQVFKAVAKGCEIIKNVADILKNRLDPSLCENSDLVNIAKLVGTELRPGKSSGLYITVTNTEPQDITLFAGEYVYEFSNDILFTFEVLQDTVLSFEESVSYFALSNTIGAQEVTDIENMTIRRVDNGLINPSLNFSCVNNELLLGSEEETPLEFRRRILYDEKRQDSISELEDELKRLPYVFDARVVFNNTDDTAVIDGVSIPSYNALLMLNGVPKREIAAIFCRQTIYPTVMTDPEKYIPFDASCFVDGVIKVYHRDFLLTNYDVEVAYTYDPLLVTSAEIQTSFDIALLKFKQNNKHSSVITEGEFYSALSTIYKPSLKIQYVKLYQDNEGTPELVDFVSVPATRIPKLVNITYTEDV